MAVADTWLQGDSYEAYVGRWSRRVAPVFLTWLDPPLHRDWLDLGCGTGALSESILDRYAPASLVGVEPSEGFLATARNRLGAGADLRQGTGTAIPVPDESTDLVVSGLVLNFIPEPVEALDEMARVARRGAVIAAYVWDYAEGIQLMRHFWDAAVALDPDARRLDEGVRFPICRREALERLFEEAGLDGVATTPIEVPTPFASFDEYWRPFLGGQGPAPAYAMSLGEEKRERLRERIRQGLAAKADGSIDLRARAWAVKGTVRK